MTISGLTRGRLVGENDVAKQSSSPALPDVQPAPQAGCFVSRLSISCESQIALRHRAFGTVAMAPSSGVLEPAEQAEARTEVRQGARAARLAPPWIALLFGAAGPQVRKRQHRCGAGLGGEVLNQRAFGIGLTSLGSSKAFRLDLRSMVFPAVTAPRSPVSVASNRNWGRKSRKATSRLGDKADRQAKSAILD
jgi:hypothetical protein